MEDTPFAEDNASSGKRKRSPGNLVEVPIPIPLSSTLSPGSHISPRSPVFEGHPLPKRPRLPLRSLDHAAEHRATIEDLSTSVLQHIFTYVDPPTLASLVTVDKRFRTLLDPRFGALEPKGRHDVLPTRPQDSVWAASRRRYIPSMPKPLSGLTEHAQFALTFGKSCQFCAFAPARPADTSKNPWQAGPGSHGIRIVWPLKIRACEACLLPRLRKVRVLHHRFTCKF